MSNPSDRKRAALHTLGCRLNQSETLLLQDKFAAAGYTIVPFDAPADIGVINTCTVTREADAKSRKAVRGFIRRNPEAFVAVIGCYSQMGAEELAQIEGVDLIVGNQEKLHVLDYAATGKLEEPLIIRDRIDRDDFTIEAAGTSDFTRRANLKIQDGCDFMCSFCVIPFARGRARSREFEDLEAEAQALVYRGAKELVLTGVNIGTYKHQDRDILDVVDTLNKLDGLERIRISSIEPTTIPHALLDRMADPDHRLVAYLHIPLQSGSDTVLDRMRRKYSRSEYRAFIETAVERVPDIGIGTDILVGMPGETDADFESTCELLRDAPIDYAHVFKFSERDGTAAARMPDPVAPQIINQRAATVRQLSERKQSLQRQRFDGRILPVLFEQRDGEYWTGLTENYIRVAVKSNDILENCIQNVRLRAEPGTVMHGDLCTAAFQAASAAR